MEKLTLNQLLEKYNSWEIIKIRTENQEIIADFKNINDGIRKTYIGKNKKYYENRFNKNIKLPELYLWREISNIKEKLVAVKIKKESDIKFFLFDEKEQIYKGVSVKYE